MHVLDLAAEVLQTANIYHNHTLAPKSDVKKKDKMKEKIRYLSKLSTHE